MGYFGRRSSSSKTFLTSNRRIQRGKIRDNVNDYPTDTWFTIRFIDAKTDVGRRLKLNLLDAVSRRLSPLENNKLVAKATFLDPRFKKYAFGVEDHAKNAQQWVTDEVAQLIANNQREADVPAAMETDVRSDDLWSYFDEKVANQTNLATPSTSAHLAVKQYVEMKAINRKMNPLDFWRNHEKTFPELAILAQKYLCVPATSVPSERLFSKTGCLTQDRRSRLGSKKMNQIIFINGNT